MNSQIIKLSFLLISFILVITSCDDNIPQDTNQPNSIGNVPVINYNYSLSELAVNNNDKADENFNTQLIEATEQLKDLLRLQQFSTILANELKSHNSLRIKSLVTKYPQLGTNLSANQLGNFRFIKETKTTLKSLSINENDVPELYCPNKEVADFNKSPILCYGFEVDTTMSGLEIYNNFIPAWYETENGEKLDFLINEQTALNSTHPVYILTNGGVEVLPETNSSNSPIVSMKSSSAINTYFSITSIQVNHRYERTGASDIYICGALFNDQNFWSTPIDFSYETEKKVRDIKKRDIGKTLSVNRSVCVYDPEPFDQNFLFFNIYERDWYSSAKSLGTITINGKTAYLSGRMKFSNEWYAFDPSTISNHPIDLQSAYTNGYIWISNSKGKFKISKIYQ